MGDDGRESMESPESEKNGGNGKSSLFNIVDKRFWVNNEEDVQIEKTVNLLPTYVEQLKRENEESEKKLKEYISVYKQQLSENDGVKKRLEDSFKLKVEQAKGEIINSLLPVADNLERAIIAGESDGDQKTLLEGIKMVQNFFLDKMKQNGLVSVESIGKSFDPNTEEAVAIEPVSDESMDNQVIEEFEKGYLLGNRLLRPAKVKVGKFSGVSN